MNEKKSINKKADFKVRQPLLLGLVILLFLSVYLGDIQNASGGDISALDREAAEHTVPVAQIESLRQTGSLNDRLAPANQPGPVYRSESLPGAQPASAPAVLAQAYTVTYTYDALGRLTGVDYGGGKTISYNYDSLGNRQLTLELDTTLVKMVYLPAIRR